MAKTLRRVCLAALSALFLACLVLLGACGGDKKSAKLTFYDGEEEYTAVEAEVGADISDRLPKDPEKEGFSFDGWFANAEGTGEKQELPTVMPEQGGTYYAKWTEKAKATLTLEPGIGSLDKTEYEVYVGKDLSDYLKDIVPAVSIEGVSFGGWYQGEKLIASGDTMSESGLTLTAKYTTGYTANVYQETTEGTYPAEPSVTETGTAFYGEPFEYEAEIPAHFTIDYAEGKAETESLAANDVFTVYLRRDRITVAFYGNIPEGKETEKLVEQVTVPYGATVSFPAGSVYGFKDADYRFGGFADDLDGEVTHKTGETFTAEANGFFYAHWDKAARDIFGGEDRIFTPAAESGVAYLVREGVGEKKGTYNATSGVFTFAEGEKTVLSGKIVGESFYYYNKTLERDYQNYDESGAVLTFLADGKASYKETADAEAVTGVYDVDEQTGDYVFEGGEKKFVFRLVEKDNEVVFRTPGEERGYYAAPEGFPVYFLSGYGEFHLYADPNQPYTNSYGDTVYEFSGDYEVYDETAGIWHARTWLYSSEYVNEELYFKLNDSVTHVSGYEIAGTYESGDGWTGDYADDYRSSNYTLRLDGFGKGVYNGAEGTYEVLHWVYTTDGTYAFDHNLIRFVAEAEEGQPAHGTYLRITQYLSQGDTIYYYTVESEFVVSDENPDGMFPFENRVLLEDSYYDDGFLFLYGDGSAEVWIKVSEATSSAGVRVNVYGLYKFAQGTIEATDEEGGFRFKTSSQDYSTEFEFKLQESGSVLFFGDQIKISDDLVIDGNGVAKYQGTEVEYTVSEGIVDDYKFTYPDGTEHHWFLLRDGTWAAASEETTYEVYEASVYDSTGYITRLTVIGSNGYLGVLLNSGDYQYIYSGTVTETTLGEIAAHRFQQTASLSEIPSGLSSAYASFSYRTFENDGVHSFQRYQYAGTYSNFDADGFGNATYTKADGTELTGTYYQRPGIQSTFVFTGEDGKVYYLYRVPANQIEGSNEDAVKEVGAEVGRYYYATGFAIDGTSYIYLDGQGVARAYLGSWQDGTYKLLESVGEYTQVEYTSDDKATTLRFIIREVGLTGGTRTWVYYEIDYAQYGEYDVVGGGHISGNGYGDFGDALRGSVILFYAEYTDAEGNTYEGILRRVTMDDKDVFYSSGRSYQLDEDGTSVVFIAIEGGVRTHSWLFDIVKDEEGNDVLSERDSVFGAYARYVGGTHPGDYLYLNGHGVAELYTKGAKSDDPEKPNDPDKLEQKGTYKRAPEIDEYTFLYEGDDGETRFYFSMFIDTYYYEYRVYTAEEDGIYYNDDWSVLLLDGYKTGKYIDAYGVVTEGEYLFLDIEEGFGYFSSPITGFETMFRLDTEKSSYTFVNNGAGLTGAYYAEDMQSIIFTDAMATIKGVSTFYTYEEGVLKLYPYDAETDTYSPVTLEFTGGQEGDVKTFVYEEVTYYYYAGGAIYFRNDEYDLTLSFTPDPTDWVILEWVNFCGNTEDYRLEVGRSWTGENVWDAVLAYFDPEYLGVMSWGFNAKLHYTGDTSKDFETTKNTFEVTPWDRDADMYDILSYDTSKQVEKGHISIVDHYIGGYTVEKNLVVDLPYATDSKNAKLSYTGDELSATSIGAYDSTYGSMLYEIVLPGTDGKQYAVRFYQITNKEKLAGFTGTEGIEAAYLLEGVYVKAEKTFGSSIGQKVIVNQLVYANYFEKTNAFSGEKLEKYDIANVDVYGINPFSGEALQSPVALMIAPDGSYAGYAAKNNTYYITFTYDNDGFVTDMALVSSYYYKAADSVTVDGGYAVSVIYSGQKVYAILSFAKGEEAIPVTALSVDDTGRIWTLTAAQTNYTVTFTITGSGTSAKISATVASAPVGPVSKTATYDVTTMGYSAGQTMTQEKVEDVTITFGGSGTAANYRSEGFVRVFVKDTITFAVPDGYVITKITISHPQKGCNFSTETGDIVNGEANGESVWTGSAQTVVLSVGVGSVAGNIGIQKIVIEYGTAPAAAAVAPVALLPARKN